MQILQFTKRFVTSYRSLNVRKSDSLVSEYLKCEYNAAKQDWSFHWSKLSDTNIKALMHFDKFYSHAYGKDTWLSCRLAFLCPPAKVAVQNKNFKRDKETSGENINIMKHLLRQWVDKNLHCMWKRSLSYNNDLTSKDEDNSLKNIIEHRSLLLKGSEAMSEFVSASELITDNPLYTNNSRSSINLVSTQGNSGTPLTIVQDLDSSVALDNENEVPLPEFLSCVGDLSVLGRPPGAIPSLFKPPAVIDDVSEFYPLDFASIVPVMCMGLKKGDSVLDLCAAPGGKAVAIYQTNLPGRMLCVDKSHSRLDRLSHVLRSQYGNSPSEDEPQIDVMHSSSLQNVTDLFDRVLVDVPCSTDRHAITSSEGSIFSKGRNDERLKLPSKQKELLMRGMDFCKENGSVVYSTCTMSPAQNECIIQAAIDDYSSEHPERKFAVVDLRPLSRLLCQTKALGHMFSRTVYLNSESDSLGTPVGLQILPRVSANYGPMFVAKLKRIS